MFEARIVFSPSRGSNTACAVASCDPAGLSGNCSVLTPVSAGTLCRAARRTPPAAPLVVNWILRAPIAGTGGGYFTIFRLANALARAGHRVRVYVEAIGAVFPKAWDVEENFGGLEGSVASYLGSRKLVFATRVGGRTTRSSS